MMKVALFAGTFDPPTLGHQEIIERAALLCGKLYVAVAKSEGKNSRSLLHEERISLLQTLTKTLKNVKIVPFTGLVVDFAKKQGVDFLVRGIRNSADLDYEMQMASANKRMTGIETLCLLSSPELSQINSTLIREIASHGKRLDGFVPALIEESVFKLLSKHPN
ncbi:MAG TPA: pantetheine-phosphate adenylyltransferase [Parachlamydiaceae bacterium]|nr:pantetheine-phosphate adenylyltransferase [Parachlamydiaceae bacterium]